MIPSCLDHRCRHTGPESVGVASGIFDPRPTTVQSPDKILSPDSRTIAAAALPGERWCHGWQHRLEASYCPDKTSSPAAWTIAAAVPPPRASASPTKHYLQLPKRLLRPSCPRERRNHGGVIDLRSTTAQNECRPHPLSIRVPQQRPKLAQLEKEVKERLKKKDVQKEEVEDRPPWVNPGLLITNGSQV
ncbi:hypothetical protein K438DRAFT_1775439 [Mycena galopus ATCC 62051]|nr:hypothetical protein K438DRAFT_1775439 [Mycena galopus ATCC 62051]